LNLINPIELYAFANETNLPLTNATFTHAGLTTRYRKENLYKSIFVFTRYIVYKVDITPA